MVAHIFQVSPGNSAHGRSAFPRQRKTSTQQSYPKAVSRTWSSLRSQLFTCLFETGSHCVAQVSPESTRLLPLLLFSRQGVAQVSPELTKIGLPLLPTAGIKGAHHQAWPVPLFLDVNANRQSIGVLKKTAKGIEKLKTCIGHKSLASIMK